MLEKNIQAITTYKPYMLNLIEELDQEDYPYEGQITDIFFSESAKGEAILGVQKEGHDYYLGSRYDNAQGILRWTAGFEKSRQYGTVVIVGMANLTYLREMRKEYPQVRLLVYEPDKYLWGENLLKVDMTDMIADEMVNFVVGEIGFLYLKELLELWIDYANYKQMQVMVSPNYDKLYPKATQKIQDIAFHRIQDIIVDRNTAHEYHEQYIRNRWSNFFDSLWQCNAGDIRACFSDIDFEKTPAIIVSAGPSLDKNIELLREVKGKAFIISADTANPVLAKHNIIPDMSVTIDPKKYLPRLYGDERMKKIPALVYFDARADIVHHHLGKRFYFHEQYSFFESIWEKYHKDYIKLETAGSVANDAFSFVRKMGFQTIILIGQDLAYTGDKVHSDDSYEESMITNDVSRKELTYVIQDIDGNDVKTDYAMDIYRRWFEDQIKIHKHLRVIDATEGGAKIEGTEIMTLREAIDAVCMDLNVTDFIGKMNQISRTYTKDERNEICDYLCDLTEHMKGEIPKKFDDIRRCYQKLEELNHKRKYTGSTFEHVMEQITQFNHWMTENPEIDLLHIFAEKEGYEVMEDIYDYADDLYENLKHIAESGIKMVDAYQKATKQYVKMMNAIIARFLSDEYKSGKEE